VASGCVMPWDRCDRGPEHYRPSCFEDVMDEYYWMHLHHVVLEYNETDHRILGEVTLTTLGQGAVKVRTFAVHGSGPHGPFGYDRHDAFEGVFTMGPEDNRTVRFEMGYNTSGHPTWLHLGINVFYEEEGDLFNSFHLDYRNDCLRRDGGRFVEDVIPDKREWNMNCDKTAAYYREPSSYSITQYLPDFADYDKPGLYLPPPNDVEFWSHWCPQCYPNGSDPFLL